MRTKSKLQRSDFAKARLFVKVILCRNPSLSKSRENLHPGIFGVGFGEPSLDNVHSLCTGVNELPRFPLVFPSRLLEIASEVLRNVEPDHCTFWMDHASWITTGPAIWRVLNSEHGVKCHLGVIWGHWLLVKVLKKWSLPGGRCLISKYSDVFPWDLDKMILG